MPDPSGKSFDTRALEDLLKQSNEKLESIDKSIDFLTAVMSGEDPLGIELGTAAYGRLQRVPRKQHAHALHRPAPEEPIKEKLINIDTKLVEEALEDMIKEELEVILTDDEAVEMFGDQIMEAEREWSSSQDSDRGAIDDLYAENKRLVEQIGDMSLRFEALSPESQKALEKGLWSRLISYIEVVINRGRRSRGEEEL